MLEAPRRAAPPHAPPDHQSPGRGYVNSGPRAGHRGRRRIRALSAARSDQLGRLRHAAGVRPRTLRPRFRPGACSPMTGVSSGPGGSWRTGRRIRRALYGVALVTALTAVCSGCMPWTSRGPPTGAHTAGPHRAVITVGAFDFPESVLLA